MNIYWSVSWRDALDQAYREASLSQARYVVRFQQHKIDGRRGWIAQPERWA